MMWQTTIPGSHLEWYLQHDPWKDGPEFMLQVYAFDGETAWGVADRTCPRCGKVWRAIFPVEGHGIECPFCLFYDPTFDWNEDDVETPEAPTRVVMTDDVRIKQFVNPLAQRFHLSREKLLMLPADQLYGLWNTLVMLANEEHIPLLIEDDGFQTPVGVPHPEESAIDRAKSVTLLEREQDYAHPAVNFLRVGIVWTLDLADILMPGRVIGPARVARLMAAFKHAREMNGYKFDNVVDAIGYWSCYDRIHKWFLDHGILEGVEWERDASLGDLYELLQEVVPPEELDP